jgi:hypothetical protein
MKSCFQKTCSRRAVLVGLATWPAVSHAQVRETLRTLPDGEVTNAPGLRAYLIDPTDRYDHGVLGDAIEAGGFAVETGGKTLVHRLGVDSVFEDRRVRLADIDGDGRPEAIVVKSYLGSGAAIAAYRLKKDGIELLAENPAIGTRNRWLNPVGVADFTGSGQPLIAAVVTPHLAGSLRLYKLSGSSLVEVTRIDGFTNHIIGSRDLDLGHIAEINNGGVPVIVLPTLDRQSLAAISFRGGARVIRQVSAGGRIRRVLAVRGNVATIVMESGQRRKISLAG